MFFFISQFFSGRSVCIKGAWNCSNEDCAKKVQCPGNQVYRKDSPSCGGTCATYGQCKGDKPQIEGCACPGIKVLTANVSKIQFLSKAVSYKFLCKFAKESFCEAANCRRIRVVKIINCVLFGGGLKFQETC